MAETKPNAAPAPTGKEVVWEDFVPDLIFGPTDMTYFASAGGVSSVFFTVGLTAALSPAKHVQIAAMGHGAVDRDEDRLRGLRRPDVDRPADPVGASQRRQLVFEESHGPRRHHSPCSRGYSSLCEPSGGIRWAGVQGGQSVEPTSSPPR